MKFFIDREAGEIIRLVASLFLWVCVYVCLYVRALLFEPFDLRPSFLVWRLTLTYSRLGLKVKVVGQSSRSNSDKLCFMMTFTLYVCQALTPELFFYWRGVVDIGTWLCQVQQKVQ